MLGHASWLTVFLQARTVEPRWQLVVLSVIVCAFTACDRKSPVPAIPEKKNTFQTIVFTEPKYGSTITLISETECEIKAGGSIRLAGYTRQQEDKLRIVEGGLGTSVQYFDILSKTGKGDITDFS